MDRRRWDSGDGLSGTASARSGGGGVLENSGEGRPGAVPGQSRKTGVVGPLLTSSKAETSLGVDVTVSP